MPWTLCTSGAAIAKAGLNSNATLIAYGGNNKTILDNWSDEAEAEASDLARYDLVANYGSLTSGGKTLFSTYTSAKIGQRIIFYDMSGYTSGNEAIAMLNVLQTYITDTASIITNDKNKNFLNISS